jgi:hypothetical protein
MQWLGGSAAAQPISSIDLFLAGHSIPKISAAAGADMIAEQRRIEAELRTYILELEQQVSQLLAEREAR